jgi:hypothetical protein
LSKAVLQFLAENVRHDRRGQLSQRLLPSDVAHFERKGFGDACVGDGQQGYLEGAADARLHLMNPAGDTVERKALADRIGREEGRVDLLGLGA